MFLKSSRYFKQKKIDVILRDGRCVNIISLRRLPSVTGKPVEVRANDRLDIMSQQNYSNPTMFWHIADANGELWASNLVKKTNRIEFIEVPDN